MKRLDLTPYLETNLMGNWLVTKWWFLMSDASLVMTYLGDLLTPMVFSFSMNPTPSKILYTSKRVKVNIADQVPDSVDLHFYLLIAMVLLKYRMSTNQAPTSVLQIYVYLSRDAYYQVSWGNKINFVILGSLFFTWLIWIFISCWKWHFVLLEMHWKTSMVLTGINSMLESLFKVHKFWYIWFLLLKKSS